MKPDRQQETVIELNGVGKDYRLYPGPGSRVKELLHPMRRKYHTLFHALKDVTFSVDAGESVGIIGVNGSGKSTLLKLISGVLRQSTGTVNTRGRISALLELGAGFNPDFTGMENIFFQGLLSGIPKKEMQGRVDEIIGFADIGEFVGQPVRTYSSGMFVRLAFAIAINTDPDILIVDEALAVGDAYFQAKCIKKIRAMQDDGVTLLFVSHDPGAVLALCNRAVLLAEGSVVAEGDPETVYNIYNARLSNQAVRLYSSDPAAVREQMVSGTGQAVVENLQILVDGKPADSVVVGGDVRLQADIRIREPLEQLVFGFMIKDRFGQIVFGTNTHYTDNPMTGLDAGQAVSVAFRFGMDLGPGEYSVSTALVDGPDHLDSNYEWKDLVLMFRVVPGTGTHFIGHTRLDYSVEVDLI